ncbi:carbohydrate ABC transporter permease [Martelella mediterranea]|uniref:Lactose transport system permease protein LacF n=1 Tax=Martelella mediterranea DSM 17316 TaxID=1122214 RepID=A0A1U9Z8F2_9HYPH|nr:sugar ABC transporter permease [Martelella mediterranea]AQZ53975.1 Lactose transport system permease protein LacF [Martelella mediterranea DSM 17316]
MSNFQIRPRRPARPLYYLAPAIALLAVFFLAPIVVNIVIAFTDMGANLRVGEFTFRNFERIVQRDARIPMVLLTTLIYVTATLFIFNIGLGALLAITSTAIPDRLGNFFRGLWLLPRMSPAVLYAILWIWIADPTSSGLLNQVTGAFGLPPLNLRNDFPLLLVILANGVVGASFAMVILTSSVRSIPAHLANAARVDGASEWGVLRHVVAPALSQPIRFITIYQALSLLTTYEYILLITGGGPVYDSTPYALYIYRRAFDNGAYAYGAALALGLMVIGIAFTLVQWRVTNMRDTFAAPKIEVL